MPYQESTSSYRQASIDLQRLLPEQPENLGLNALSAAMQVLMRNADGAHATIERICKGYPDKMPLVLDLYSRLIAQYPQYVPALRTRGQIFDAMGETDLAIADFEAAIQRESGVAVLLDIERLIEGIKLS